MVDTLDRPKTRTKAYVTPGTTAEEVARRQRRLDSMVEGIIMPRKEIASAPKESKPPMTINEFYGGLYTKAKALPIWKGHVWGAVAGVAASAALLVASVMASEHKETVKPAMADAFASAGASQPNTIVQVPALNDPSLPELGYGSISQPSFINDTVPSETLNLSAKWQKIYDRALEGHAQSQKDVAMAMYNGIHGFEKNEIQAQVFYTKAEMDGNIQAKVDQADIVFQNGERRIGLNMMQQMTQDSKIAIEKAAQFARLIQN